MQDLAQETNTSTRSFTPMKATETAIYLGIPRPRGPLEESPAGGIMVVWTLFVRVDFLSAARADHRCDVELMPATDERLN